MCICESPQHTSDMSSRCDTHTMLSQTHIHTHTDFRHTLVYVGKSSPGSAHLQHLDADARADIIQLINTHPTLFSDTPSHTTVLSHNIDVDDDLPINGMPTVCNPTKCALCRKEVDYLLKNGLTISQLHRAEFLLPACVHQTRSQVSPMSPSPIPTHYWEWRTV